MAHFAARAHRRLAVKMCTAAPGIVSQRPVILDLAADQVGHLDPAVADGLGQRPAGDRADVLLELRHRRAVERPVSGIVHPRRDLVDQKPAVAQHEHLDREHADIGEFLRDRFGDAAAPCRARLAAIARRHARIFRI